MTIKRAQGSNGTGLLLTLAVLVGPSAAQAQSLDEIFEAALAATGPRRAAIQPTIPVRGRIPEHGGSWS